MQALVATYRCQANTNRLEMKIRPSEQSVCSLLRLYISPNTKPRCAVLKTFRFPCLCLHVRCHDFQWNTPYSQVTFKGKQIPSRRKKRHSQCLIINHIQHRWIFSRWRSWLDRILLAQCSRKTATPWRNCLLFQTRSMGDCFYLSVQVDLLWSCEGYTPE